jgi:thiol-disulfide isomerase/thioredoxin
MKRRTALTLGGGAAALAGAATLWLARGPKPATLVPAVWPALPVHSLTGQAQALDVQAPTPRLINLWARWCAPCRRELPSLQRLAARLGRLNIDVLALAVEEDPFALREYVAALRLALPVWRLAPAESLRLEASGTLPQTWLVAPSGRVLARWPGERDWDQPALQQQLLALAAQSLDKAQDSPHAGARPW